MVARCYNHVGPWILRLYAPAYVSNARCGIASARLEQYVFGLHFGQLFAHNVGILLICHYPHVLGRAYALEPVVCKLQQRTTDTKDVDELLRAVGCAHRPESAAYSACHNNKMITYSSHKKVYCLSCKDRKNRLHQKLFWLWFSENCVFICFYSISSNKNPISGWLFCCSSWCDGWVVSSPNCSISCCAVCDEVLIL